MFKKQTLNEAIDALDSNGGYPLYIDYILGLLFPEPPSPELPSESDFMKSVLEPAPDIDEDLGRAAKLIPQSLDTIFRQLKWIAEIEQSGDSGGSPDLLRASHCDLFRLLYQVGVKMQMLFSVLIDRGEHDGEDEYLDYLKKEYHLPDAYAELLKMLWTDLDIHVTHGLLEGDLILTPFSGEPVCFLLRNLKMNPVFKAPSYLKTENDLIISKYFFLTRLITILQTLELMAEITACETQTKYDETQIGFREVFEIDTFVAIAREMVSRSDA